MDAQTVHDFWFGGPLDDAAFVRARLDVWFKTDFDFDDEVRRRFSGVLEQAAAGGLAHWNESALGILMRVVVLDQMPRNIHRGSPRAFATDDLARVASESAFARGLDTALSLIERVFLYMPFEHAEDLAAQDFCVAGYRRLLDEAPPDFRELMQACVEAGEAHREVIRRFGRFPHRNPILGRSSTPEELAWSENHHGWGQGEKVLRKRPGG